MRYTNRHFTYLLTLLTLAVDGWAVIFANWYSEEGPGRSAAPPRPILAVPNVTAHPSTASVPTSCYSTWHRHSSSSSSSSSSSTADTRKLVVSRTRSSFRDRTFAAAGHHKSRTVCRPISMECALCGLSYGQFRRLLKTFLFRQ